MVRYTGKSKGNKMLEILRRCVLVSETLLSDNRWRYGGVRSDPCPAGNDITFPISGTLDRRPPKIVIVFLGVKSQKKSQNFICVALTVFRWERVFNRGVGSDPAWLRVSLHDYILKNHMVSIKF